MLIKGRITGRQNIVKWISLLKYFVYTLMEIHVGISMNGTNEMGNLKF